MPAGRPPSKPAKSAATPTNEVAIRADFDAADQLAAVDAERQARLKSLASKLGYQGDLSGPALMDGARGSKTRLGMAILEHGAYLLLLKEGCDHGQFGQVLASLDIEERSARKYMSMARRFANRPSTAVLEAAGYAKMVELLALEDEQTDELLEYGKTGELALDDLVKMSLSEVRQAARKARIENERYRAVNQELNTELAHAKHKLRGKVPEFAPMDERLAPFQKDITERHSLMQKCVMADVEAVKALQVWWEAEAAAQAEREGLAADQYVPMPPAARAVLLHLDSAVTDLASWVGTLQHALLESFANELQLARQHQMQEPEGEGIDEEPAPRRGGGKRG